MPYMLPQQPPRQTGWDQAGFATGVGLDILLKALLAGQLGPVATAGMYTAPTGASTAISPAERVAPGQPGAGRSLASVLQQSPGPGTFQGTGFGGLRAQPNLDRQLKQSQLQQSQAMVPYIQSLSQGQTAQPGVTPAVLKQLEDDALSGDEDAVAAYRYLKARGGG